MFDERIFAVHFEPRTFAMIRRQDVTGASGIGHVADGVVFPDGTTVVRWRGDNPSTVVWPSWQAAEAVHGHGGATEFVWEDGGLDPS